MAHNLAVIDEPNETEQRRHNNEVLRTIIGLLNDFFPTEGSYSIMELAIAASQVSFDSAGNLSSDNVQDALEELDDEKQETLVSGANIKTINSESILGSGNISIATGISEAPIDGNTYGRKDGAWEQVSVSGGGASITIDTYANRPASPSDNEIFLPTDSIYAQVYDSSAWKTWGPIWRMVPFVSGDFTWVNQGAATLTESGGMSYLYTPAASGNSLKILKKSKSGTFTVTLAFIPNIRSVNYASCGIVFRNNSSGKIVYYSFAPYGTKFAASKFNDATNYNSAYTTSATYSPHDIGNVVWMRATDNGTNRIAEWSTDGFNWNTIHSVARTDFITADEVGICVDSNSSTAYAAMNVLSWEES